jgi:outer membrane immunogenic protein
MPMSSRTLDTSRMLATGIFAAYLSSSSLLAPALADGLNRETHYVPSASWTGFYVGIGVGAQWDKDSWQTGLIGFPLGPNDGVTSHQSFDQVRPVAGVFGGYNLQHGRMVFGVEGGFFPGTNIRSTVDFIPGAAFPPPIFPGDTATVEENWDAFVRARAGVLVTRSTLAYVAAGYAVREIQVGASCTNISTGLGNWCVANRSELVDKTLNGFTVGGGVETLIGSHVLLRLDYRFSDYGKISHTFFANDPIDQVQMKLDSQSHIGMVGLAYKF